jgi:hypothetical protein
MQNDYWRQRFTSRLLQFGDENTKFFHAMASERYRKNIISQIMDGPGRMISDHGGKSALFLQEFKNSLDTRWRPQCNLTFKLLSSLIEISITYLSLSLRMKLIGSFWTCLLIRLLSQMTSATHSLKSSHD